MGLGPPRAVIEPWLSELGLGIEIKFDGHVCQQVSLRC